MLSKGVSSPRRRIHSKMFLKQHKLVTLTLSSTYLLTCQLPVSDFERTYRLPVVSYNVFSFQILFQIFPSKADKQYLMPKKAATIQKTLWKSGGNQSFSLNGENLPLDFVPQDLLEDNIDEFVNTVTLPKSITPDKRHWPLCIF